MTNKIFYALVLAFIVFTGCQSEYPGVPSFYYALLDSAMIAAGENRGELEKALSGADNENKEAVAYLIAYMPERDLQSLDAGFILDQAEGAVKVRSEFDWCRELPDSIFLNEVLPYCNLDEDRDNWRADFYNRFSPFVKECTTIYEAIDSVNRNILNELGVEYNTRRSAVNISPFKAIGEQMATCTGLSFLLVDAFRSVGIPARIAGTPLWTNFRGNHSWVEVWIDGEWFFTEYYPEALNKSWFLADAGKADPQKPVHWIYAASYKPAETHYPLVWDPKSKDIHAVNVTNRYIRLYKEHLVESELNDDELIVDVVMYKNKNEQEAPGRVSERVSVWEDDVELDFGFTPRRTDDMNNFLKFRLKKQRVYRLEFSGAAGEPRSQEINTGTYAGEVVELFQETS